ncbi:MAG: hypothetical protein ACYCY8_00020 [Burkholderiales bacterium]
MPGNSSQAPQQPIGGYFELELPLQHQLRYPDALRFQSARAGFYALLLAGKPKRIWMPKYICDVMLPPITSAKVETVFYDLDSNLEVSRNVSLKAGDWLFYANYFGVCSAQEDSLMQRFNPDQLVLDHSQAFFEAPKKCLATLYSPRKFFGVPDGGLLFTSINLTEPEEIESRSASRCAHLLKRLDGATEEGYADFRNAEETLSDFRPRKMSLLTRRLLSYIDYDTCEAQRNDNFTFLHKHFRHSNELSFSHVNGPMCYPLLVEDTAVRKDLLANHIYVPAYWRDVGMRVAAETVEKRMADKCLPLPCDHRYSKEDLLRIVDIMSAAI